MSAIFSFISTLYLKQQNNILGCFSSLNIENSLFSNKFFPGKMVYTAENDQIKYFVQNWVVKITFLFVQTTSSLCYYCHKLRFFKFEECFKGLFHHSENCMFFISNRSWTTTTSNRIHSLNRREWEQYKNFKIFNIKSCPWYILQLL